MIFRIFNSEKFKKQVLENMKKKAQEVEYFKLKAKFPGGFLKCTSRQNSNIGIMLNSIKRQK